MSLQKIDMKCEDYECVEAGRGQAESGSGERDIGAGGDKFVSIGKDSEGARWTFSSI